MPRRKQPEITRKAILRSAGNGFARSGYHATGIGAIAEGSGLTRGALFHHFPDKESLAAAWLREVLEPALVDAHRARFDGVSGFRSWKEGCLSLLDEMDAEHPVSLLSRLGGEWSEPRELRQETARVFGEWHALVAGTLARGQKEGWIHRSIQPQDEAMLLISQWCGASLAIRLQGAASAAMFGRALAAYLETLRSVD